MDSYSTSGDPSGLYKDGDEIYTESGFTFNEKNKNININITDGSANGAYIQ